MAASVVLLVTGAFEASEVGVETLGVLFVPGAVFGLVYVGIAGLVFDTVIGLLYALSPYVE